MTFTFWDTGWWFTTLWISWSKWSGHWWPVLAFIWSLLATWSSSCASSSTHSFTLRLPSALPFQFIRLFVLTLTFSMRCSSITASSKVGLVLTTFRPISSTAVCDWNPSPRVPTRYPDVVLWVFGVIGLTCQSFYLAYSSLSWINALFICCLTGTSSRLTPSLTAGCYTRMSHSAFHFQTRYTSHVAWPSVLGTRPIWTRFSFDLSKG